MTQTPQGATRRPPGGKGRRILVAAGALAAAVFVGANAHLAWVAFASQPDCVAHAKPGSGSGNGAGGGGFSAAKSSC